MNNACVIGYGMVGKATALAFNIKKYYSRTDSNMTLEDCGKMKYIFICLPTPVIKGQYFMEDIYNIIKQIASYPRHVDNFIIIRSTVYPGFAKYVQETLDIDNVVSNPEFLSEETWKNDAKKPKVVVIGGDNDKYRQDLNALYMGRFKYCKPIITNTSTAEMIKLTMNAFFSTKVMFFNEIFDYAQVCKANYETIKEVIESHPWGTKNHTTIWYKEKRGIHGRCLPKDLEALANLSGSRLLQTIHNLNERFL